MPLRNRVTPEGEIIATPARGLLMGNRGGEFHRPDRTLGTRRWASRAWIACTLSYQGRHERIWVPRHYTQLFFLDEATALAAGHRPCALCRRADFERFRALWPYPAGSDGRPKATAIDLVLHEERLLPGRGGARGKRDHEEAIAAIPAGCFVRCHGDSHLVTTDGLLPWRPDGYGPPIEKPARGRLTVLTPRSVVEVMRRGYCPALHPTAAAIRGAAAAPAAAMPTAAANWQC